MLSRSAQFIKRSYSSSVPKVHAVASKGFNLQTDAYAQTRPSYPHDLLEKIKSIVPAKDARMVDLAAGTGLMTKCLVESGFHVTAIEPVGNMRLKLNQILPQVTCLEGTSWHMPVKDDSLDAVVIAQAFHWFDDIKTLQELHRVLKPAKGYGILAWNLESRERSDWVAKLRDAYEVFDKNVPQFRKMGWKKVFETEEAKALFKLPYQSVQFKNDFWVPKPDIWRRVSSKSYVACLDTEKQQALKQHIESILENVPVDDQNRVFLPHDSYLIYFEKK